MVSDEEIIREELDISLEEGKYTTLETCDIYHLMKKAREDERERVTLIISQLEARVNGFMVDLEHFKKEVDN